MNDNVALLRAMAANYRNGHSVDKLDLQALTRAADELEATQTQLVAVEAERKREVEDRMLAESKLDEAQAENERLTKENDAFRKAWNANEIIAQRDTELLARDALIGELRDAASAMVYMFDEACYSIKLRKYLDRVNNALAKLHDLSEVEEMRRDARRLDWIESKIKESGYAVLFCQIRDPEVNAGMNQVKVISGYGSGVFAKTHVNSTVRSTIDYGILAEKGNT